MGGRSGKRYVCNCAQGVVFCGWCTSCDDFLAARVRVMVSHGTHAAADADCRDM